MDRKDVIEFDQLKTQHLNALRCSKSKSDEIRMSMAYNRTQ